jgi:dTDP-4-dehydrorhamnose reductase
MPQATLTFDLTDSDDAMAHLRAVKSLDLALAIWDIVHNTKKSLEWSLESKEEISRYDVVDLVYDKIYAILEEHDVVIDKLIV